MSAAITRRLMSSEFVRSSFLKMLFTCRSTPRFVMKKARAIAALLSLGDQREDVQLSSGQSGKFNRERVRRHEIHCSWRKRLARLMQTRQLSATTRSTLVGGAGSATGALYRGAPSTMYFVRCEIFSRRTSGWTRPTTLLLFGYAAAGAPTRNHRSRPTRRWTREAPPGPAVPR